MLDQRQFTAILPAISGRGQIPWLYRWHWLGDPDDTGRESGGFLWHRRPFGPDKLVSLCGYQQQHLDNQWHYLAGVWTGTQLQIYEDGMLENTLDQSATPANNSRDVEIGGAWGGGPPTRFFHGMIDEVTYYSRALTAAETQSIYASGSLGKCKPPQMLPQFSGTGFNFGFQSVSNQSYTIQRNDDLTTTNWIFFTNFTGDGSLLQLVSPVTNAPQRYFRLRQP